MIFQMLTIVSCLIAVLLLFLVVPLWSWLLIGIVDLFLGLQLITAKRKYQFKQISDLSYAANALLHQYGHYFAMPLACKDFSASAATIQFAGIIIGLLGIIRGFWLGLGIAALNWLVMGFIAVSLSPISLVSKKPEIRTAYDEVSEYLINHATNSND
jgi:hypothetical protein